MNFLNNILIFILFTEYTAGSFNASRDRYFVGLNDLEDEGVYKRADGSNITFQAYFTSQPDDKDGNEDCTAVGKEEYVRLKIFHFFYEKKIHCYVKINF